MQTTLRFVCAAQLDRYVSKNQMILRVITTMFLALATSAIAASSDTFVRGELSNQGWTVTECNTGRIYSVRILASNPYFHFSKRVEELTSKGAKSIVAEFRGEVSQGKTSTDPGNRVDGTLNVHQVVYVENGRCERLSHYVPN
ncbi:MAG: hypothetical protein OEY27_08580 [Gammaproteobacteria bacterium]|nr:hypothetical protein [Gammaproteobacteria bacterium]